MNKSRKLVMHNNERSEERKMKENTGNLENREIKSHISPLYIHHSGITLVALVVTIVLNFSYLEMARMNKFEKI